MLQIYQITALLLLALLTSCASDIEYHTSNTISGNCAKENNLDDQNNNCTQSYYQQYPNFDLAFAEFTERGNAFSEQRIRKMLDKIRSHATSQGIVLVTFIHGWKHNADENDENLISFKNNLANLSKDKSLLLGRRLVGLYVGWRGASVTIPYLDTITFWERKAVAEEVGRGGVTKLLLELDSIDQSIVQTRSGTKSNTLNVLVVVGHSFGGAIVTSALSEVLANKLVASDLQSEADEIAGIGDAVIVLNPAIEANQVLNLVEVAISRKYKPNQNPLFISISSDSDWATHGAFPIGQTLGLFFTWRQNDLERQYYKDRKSGKELMLKEEHLDSTTMGNFAPFLTHRLTADISNSEPSISLYACDTNPDACKPKGLTMLSGYPSIGPLPENYPLFFIKTDKKIMSGHNDIFNPVIQSTMLSIIDDIVRRSLRSAEIEDQASRSVLHSPERLNRRFQSFYQKNQSEKL